MALSKRIKIGSKAFMLKGTFMHQVVANNVGKEERKKGRLVRIIKHKDGWAVYTRGN